MFDVIIVGAGPAGAAAAYYLAKAGVKVLLLEKKKLPRFKPCAGGISSKFLASLPFEVSKSVKGKVSKIKYFYNLDDPFEVKLDITMAMLNREEFDYLLVQDAARLGAELIDNVQISEIKMGQDKIKILTDKGDFFGKFLIGADGVHSFVGRRVGLLNKRKIWSAFEVELEGLNHDVDTAFFGFGQLKQGYSWSFPKMDYSSVGIGGKGSKNFVTEFEKWLGFLGYKGRRKELKIYAHPIPEVEVGAKLHNDKVLLLGDAAGLVDPITGEGIRHAILSAQIATEVILTGKIDEYSRRIYKRISADFRYAYLMRWIFVNWPQFCYRIAVKDVGISRLLSCIFCGDLTYREFVGRFSNPLKYLRKIRI